MSTKDSVMMRSARKHQKPAFLLCLVMALAGCGQPRPARVEPSAGTLIQQTMILDPAALDLATNSGGFPARQHEVATAEEEVTARCMRDKGFSWSGYVFDPGTGSDEDRALGLAERRVRGYGLSSATTDRPHKQDADPSAGDTQADLALFGQPEKAQSLTIPAVGVITYPIDGCLARGHAELFGDATTWARVAYLPQGINRQLATAARADPRYADALRTWRHCMADHDYHYENPDQVTVQVQAPTLEIEIAIAVQDAECNQHARLFLVELALRREAAQALGNGQRAEVAELSAAFDSAVGRARTISSPPAVAATPPADTSTRTPTRHARHGPPTASTRRSPPHRLTCQTCLPVFGVTCRARHRAIYKDHRVIGRKLRVEAKFSLTQLAQMRGPATAGHASLRRPRFAADGCKTHLSSAAWNPPSSRPPWQPT
jgi:hypothetical protein